MDQTIIKIKDNDIKVGARVILYDKDHPKQRFVDKLGISADELFFCADKSYRVKFTS
jgi:alanine racemase